MTIVRSLGVTTLVALMSAHRLAAEQRDTVDQSFDQQMIEAIEAELRSHMDRQGGRASEPRRSYS
jgi:hypothetical protein